MPRQHWGSTTKSCISDKFCLTIGPDKNIYTCDHLTNKPYTAIGNLSTLDIDKMITKLKTRDHFTDLKNCSQCPPFNFRFNYFLPQLKSIFDDNHRKFNGLMKEYNKGNTD